MIDSTFSALRVISFQATHLFFHSTKLRKSQSKCPILKRKILTDSLFGKMTRMVSSVESVSSKVTI